ncbi:GPP34 family phosphoprotein [Streptomyces sp. NPDC088400]|uniref:GOLPH3/VPS74 family protein n=1 Tax=Streptomyces sp. NPDC088400 TaxID=3365861 RepID=UPI003829EB14
MGTHDRPHCQGGLLQESVEKWPPEMKWPREKKAGDERENMRSETLIVEDVMLMLLDDETGVPAGAGTLHYTLGGAVLVELALLGRIETDKGRAGLNGSKVLAVGDGPLPDPLLQSAYEKIAERPCDVQTLLLQIGGGLRKPVIDRLVEQGFIRRESKRMLGLFRTTKLPTDDMRHESELRRKVCAVLERGESPDARTAAVIAVLSASGTLPTFHPAPKWSTEVSERAKELERGSWGATAVNTAVTRTAAASSVASTVAIVSVIT